MTTSKHTLFRQLTKLSTESRNPASMKIDTLSVAGILRVINTEDARVPAAAKKELAHVQAAVEAVVKAFRKGGRLIYAGAGTSGRLGVIDAAECPPTYGVDPEMVQAIIAGGSAAVFRSQEGAEDVIENGAAALSERKPGKKDVVCGIAASLRTPFVYGALREAKQKGAVTVLVTTNPRRVFRSSQYAYLRKVVDIAICVDVGPEVVMGSTRMKSGTAQKLVLNMITTASMIRIGKVYENMMVDLQLTNKKLEERAKRVIMIATESTYEHAEQALLNAGGNVKTAIVMVLLGCSKAEAGRRLRKAQGFVRNAI